MTGHVGEAEAVCRAEGSVDRNLSVRCSKNVEDTESLIGRRGLSRVIQIGVKWFIINRTWYKQKPKAPDVRNARLTQFHDTDHTSGGETSQPEQGLTAHTSVNHSV